MRADSDIFRDTHAIVTGGSSGIGLATVRRLVERRARVSVVALEDEYLKSLREDSQAIHTVAADVGDRSAVVDAVEVCTQRHGPCDTLITCAGMTHPGYFDEIADDEFEREMRVNYFGTLYPIRAVVPSMLARRHGSIVAVASAAGLFGVFGYTAYGPTKFAVRGLSETLRTELAPHGVYVGCVFPTDVDTPMLADEEPLKPPETRALSGTMTPIPPDRVAAAIIDGITRRRPLIYPDLQTLALARLIGIAPGLVMRWLDRKVAKARS